MGATGRERKVRAALLFMPLYMIGNITKHITLMGQILLCMSARALTNITGCMGNATPERLAKNENHNVTAKKNLEKKITE